MGSRDCPVDCPTCDALRAGNEHAEVTMDRLMSANRQPSTRKRVLLPAGWKGLASDYAESLRTLAANLATAGALCAAFRVGFDEGWTSATRHPDPEWARRDEFRHALTIGDDDAHDWRPGCGRPMPGWGGGE